MVPTELVVRDARTEMLEHTEGQEQDVEPSSRSFVTATVKTPPFTRHIYEAAKLSCATRI